MLGVGARATLDAGTGPRQTRAERELRLWRFAGLEISTAPPAQQIRINDVNPLAREMDLGFHATGPFDWCSLTLPQIPTPHRAQMAVANVT